MLHCCTSPVRGSVGTWGISPPWKNYGKKWGWMLLQHELLPNFDLDPRAVPQMREDYEHGKVAGTPSHRVTTHGWP